MTVYIVREDDGEYNGILKVFDSQDKAEKCLEEYEKHWGFYYIDEWEVE